MSDNATTPRATGPAASGWRSCCFRAAAIALGPMVLVGLEMLCRLLGWGSAPVYEDPFVGFQGVNPLFVRNDAAGVYEVAPAKLKFFSPESFAIKKRAFRIFCLGGSTVKGRPYAKETAFSTWLELALRTADPGREWETVNCGGISYASYRLVNLLRECLLHEPDLFVICTGHNEFLEDRTYANLKHLPEALAVSQNWASRLNLYRLARGALSGDKLEPAAGRFEMAEEVEALLDYRGGLEVYDRNEKWRQDVAHHFEHNLRAMVELARNAGVPVILIRPPTNLRSTPPFKSLHRDDLSLDDRLDWQAAVNRGRDAYEDDLEKAAEALRDALTIDDRFASLHFEIGKCLERLGRVSGAKAAFERAVEEDICPLRMVAALDEGMRRVARDSGCALIDAHALLEKESLLHILGNDRLVDHVHPSIDGHKQIAGEILKVMNESGLCRTSEGWKERREQLYAEHFDSLDAAYFAAARRALHGLNEWAAGRTEGPPITARPSARPLR